MYRLNKLAVLTFLLVLKFAAQEMLLEGVIKFLSDAVKFSSEEFPEREILEEYDFIIVGAGTAGCVVANRLSENPQWKVLLLEAGSSERLSMDIPLLVYYLQFTSINWEYRTEPGEKYCRAMDKGQCHFPRGRVMGGSSVLNYMIYTRGNRRDFDYWAELGNEGWSYKDVLPYFKKVENFSIPENYDESYHGKDGFLSVTYPPYHSPHAKLIMEASIENGYKPVDYNGKTQTGTSRIQTTTKDGLRHSSNVAYLHPIKSRPNLHVKKMSFVTKILINPETKQAYGVEFLNNNRLYRVKASKEVILSAGAINTPQLLMLSGIGPKKHLKEKQINVIKSLKVGYNLMDHIAPLLMTITTNISAGYVIEDISNRTVLDVYLNRHQGLISLPGTCEQIIFIDSQDPKNPDGHPDIELLFASASPLADETVPYIFNLRKDNIDRLYKNKSRSTFSVFPMILRPKSRGRIILKDANYQSTPLIFPNFFSHPDDVDVGLKAIKAVLDLLEQPALKKVGAKLLPPLIPPCDSFYRVSDDEFWKCISYHLTSTIYHQCGTCKMGPQTDKYAVVNPRLKVYGVKGLRVIDASIIPVIPAAHINAVVYMIAEKGSDLIKQDWAS